MKDLFFPIAQLKAAGLSVIMMERVSFEPMDESSQNS